MVKVIYKGCKGVTPDLKMSWMVRLFVLVKTQCGRGVNLRKQNLE